MQDRELYEHLLGFKEPWRVEEVELNVSEKSIRVRVSHPRGTKFCYPECQRELACYDHGQERQWRHLASCQYKTFLVAAPPATVIPKTTKTSSTSTAEDSTCTHANTGWTFFYGRIGIQLARANSAPKATHTPPSALDTSLGTTFYRSSNHPLTPHQG